MSVIKNVSIISCNKGRKLQMKQVLSANIENKLDGWLLENVGQRSE